jgi:polysaccharide deacetylase family protein (PEP-CTERM system associated)
MTKAPTQIAGKIVNAMTVDVEDYFHVQAFAGVIDPANWNAMPCRVEANTDRILALLDQAQVKATMFTLGWVAQRYPQIVRRIVQAGHELASHGYNHQRVDGLSEAVFRDDVTRARALLEDIGGTSVRGYRAPTFSINAHTPWAYDVLAETGHVYSSSIYPVRHDLYGAPNAPRLPHLVGSKGLWELPMTTVQLRGQNLPCSGGGYFRLLPYALFRIGPRRANALGERAMFYTHPWEIDADQPRVAGASRLSNFRHYLNLHRTAGRLQRLLGDFAWDRVDNVFADVINPAR